MNTAREETGESEGQAASQKEAGRRDALRFMSVTELTSQLDRSELKEEAERNTARRGGWVRAKGHALGTPEGGTWQRKGRLGGGTHSDTCW